MPSADTLPPPLSQRHKSTWGGVGASSSRWASSERTRDFPMPGGPLTMAAVNRLRDE